MRERVADFRGVLLEEISSEEKVHREIEEQDEELVGEVVPNVVASDYHRVINMCTDLVQGAFFYIKIRIEVELLRGTDFFIDVLLLLERADGPMALRTFLPQDQDV